MAPETCRRCQAKFRPESPMVRPLCGECVALLSHAISGGPLTEAERQERMDRALGAYTGGDHFAAND